MTRSRSWPVRERVGAVGTGVMERPAQATVGVRFSPMSMAKELI